MKVRPNEYVEEQGPILEEDTYAATLTGFGETEGQFGPRLVWQFEVDHEGEKVEAAGFTSYSMANGKKRSNLIVWSEALLGELPEEFDLEDLVGKPCRVDVETYTKENGITKNKVVKVKPPKKGQKAAKPKKAEGDVTLEEDDFEDIPF